MPRSSVTSIGVAWLMRHRGVPNGYSTASSYQMPTSSKYYLTLTSFLAGIGITCLMQHRGVPNGYSTASSYQVPTSLKYYLMPTSFLVGIGVTWRMRCMPRMGVQMLIPQQFITKCQLVRNIFQCQRIFLWVLALLGVCGVLECKCLLYGHFLPSAN